MSAPKNIVVGSLENNILPPTPEEVDSRNWYSDFWCRGQFRISADLGGLPFAYIATFGSCAGARIIGFGLWLVGVSQPRNRGIPVDLDPSDDTRAVALLCSKTIQDCAATMGYPVCKTFRVSRPYRKQHYRFGSSGPPLLHSGLGYVFFAWMLAGKFGSVIRAIRDNETRVRFLGYHVETYKLFIFTTTAMIAGIAGALYYPQAGIINPAEIAPIASIYLAVWVAIGGRGRLYGAVIGAVVRVAYVVLVHRRQRT